MGIGLQIKRILKDKGMTIKDVYEISGISINSLYSITKRDPDMVNMETLKKISEALQININELINYSVIGTHEEIKENVEKNNLEGLLSLLYNELNIKIVYQDDMAILLIKDSQYPVSNNYLIALKNKMCQFLKKEINTMIEDYEKLNLKEVDTKGILEKSKENMNDKELEYIKFMADIAQKYFKK